MYLRSNGTYYVGTEQRARRAPFLILFSWNYFRAADEARIACSDCCMLKIAREDAIERFRADPGGNTADRAAFDWPSRCAVHLALHRVDGPTYANGNGKIWACVRSVALRQSGHWMVGRARIGQTTIAISGSCGADGLPRDVQELPTADREKYLVEVPEAVAAVYWKDNGHNTIGSARDVLTAWAHQTFSEAA